MMVRSKSKNAAPASPNTRMPGKRRVVAVENVRVGVRPKRAKIVFDPSENNKPKRRNRNGQLPQQITLRTNTDRVAPAFQYKLRKSIENHIRFIPGTTEKRTLKNTIVRHDFCGACLKVPKHDDKMLQCRDCHYKMHYACYDQVIVGNVERWQCPLCRSCSVCNISIETEILSTCAMCYDSFHWICHNPQITKATNTKWKCQNCSTCLRAPKAIAPPSKPTIPSSTTAYVLAESSVKQEVDEDNTNSKIQTTISQGSSSKSTVTELSVAIKTPKIAVGSTVSLLKTNRIPNEKPTTPSIYALEEHEIPNASEWNVDDVFGYFQKYFPEKIANVFREQEIDGQSLLLMKRSDVVNGLNLKLGPAVKIYTHIIMLQTRKNEPQILWM